MVGLTLARSAGWTRTRAKSLKAQVSPSVSRAAAIASHDE
jgi:hypothetical protein